MNYFKHLFILSLSIVILSCGGSKDSDKDISNSNEDGIGKIISNPENPCECTQLAYQKLTEIDAMSDDELKANLDIYEKYKEYMDSICGDPMKERMKKEYSSPKAFIDACEWAKKQQELKSKLKSRISKLRGDDIPSEDLGELMNQACRMYEKLNKEIDEFMSMTLDEMAENPQKAQDFVNRFQNNTQLKEIMDKIANQEGTILFIEKCEVFTEVMEKAEKMKSMKK